MYGYEIYHEKEAQAVVESIRSRKNSHAYIIEAAPGLGGDTFSQLMACALVCSQKFTKPCGECTPCIMAKAGTNPDITLARPAEKKKSIGVEVIRHINDDAFIKPFSSEKKVYIIDGDIITEESQNALLKTLEEPPEYAVFLITVSDSALLLPTIRSRCSLITLGPLSDKKMYEYIAKKYPDLTEDSAFYVRYSNGNPAVLDALLSDAEFKAIRSACADILTKIFSDSYEDSFYVSEFFDKNKERLDDILNILMLMVRDVVFLSEELADKVVNSDYRDKLLNICYRIFPQKAVFAEEILIKCCEMQKRNVSPKHMGMYFALTVKEMDVD